MVSKQRKRKIEYEGENFYWFVKTNDSETPKIHILSENKKISLEYSLFDKEVPVTPAYIKYLLKSYFERAEMENRKRHGIYI